MSTYNQIATSYPATDRFYVPLNPMVLVVVVSGLTRPNFSTQMEFITFHNRNKFCSPITAEPYFDVRHSAKITYNH
jgi:hypothetical protein